MPFTKWILQVFDFDLFVWRCATTIADEGERRFLLAFMPYLKCNRNRKYTSRIDQEQERKRLKKTTKVEDGKRHAMLYWVKGILIRKLNSLFFSFEITYRKITRIVLAYKKNVVTTINLRCDQINPERNRPEKL